MKSLYVTIKVAREGPCHMQSVNQRDDTVTEHSCDSPLNYDIDVVALYTFILLKIDLQADTEF